MNGPVTLELPLPPSDNAATRARGIFLGWTTSKFGKRIPKVTAQFYKTEDFTEYVKAIRLRIVAKYGAAALPLFPNPQQIAVGGVVRMERAGCDLPNRFKVLWDALKGGLLYTDDEQIARFDPWDRIVAGTGRGGVIITARPIDVDRYGQPLQPELVPR